MGDRYLDFNEISKMICFVDLLNGLNIPYTIKNGEIRGETGKFKFVINVQKNLFFSPDDQTIKGSVINFLSEYKSLGLREAAKELYGSYIELPRINEKPIPDLELEYVTELEEFGISKEIAREYEVGLVKQKSIMKGRITFKMYDENSKVEGYVGWHPQKKDWLFPKNFKRPLYNAHNIGGTDIAVTSDLFDCLFLLGRGIDAVSCLIARSMTGRQEEMLKGYSRILLLHPEPENIVIRLSKNSFVKAPRIYQPLRAYSEGEIVSFLQ